MRMFNFNSLRSIVLKSIKAFLISFLFGSNASAMDTDSDAVKILFIGNSYTHMNEMPKIVQKMADNANRDVIVEYNTQSDGSFRVHSERPDMYEAISKRNWDYVILQGFSRELSHSKAHIDTATVPFINKIVNAVYENNQCSQVLFYMTWGYENGYGEREEVNTYNKMADRIANGYEYLSNLYDSPTVPVGLVWKEIKKLNKMDLYAPDRAHPSKIGSYLIANTFYQAIFYDVPDKLYSSNLKKKSAKLINRTVDQYLANNFDYEGGKHDLFSIIELEDYSIQYKVSDSVSDVVWYFEDGTSTTLKAGTHSFGRRGKHRVTIELLTDCGKESHERIMKFRKPKGKMRRRKEQED